MTGAVNSAIKRAPATLRPRFFSSWSNTLVTFAILLIAWKIVPPFVDWAFFNAVWSPENPNLCRAVAGRGACWAFIVNKYRFILFGTFPADQHWRPAWAIAILLGLYALSAVGAVRRAGLAVFWLAGLAAIAVLMWGGVFGLPYVENQRWGGLTLTLLLSTFGIVFAFPLSILLALGRRSQMPLVRWLTIVYIELIRGVPLISVLFMGDDPLRRCLPR